MIGPYHKNDNGEKFITVFVEQKEEKRPTSSWIVGLYQSGSQKYGRESCGNESSGSTWGPVMKSCENGDLV